MNTSVKQWVRARWWQLAILAALITYLGYRSVTNKQVEPRYQTAQAERGTLVTSVSASGFVTTGNNLAIVTNATGTVNQVYVKNGDTVKQGQKIAEITLDQDAQQKQASAYANYMSAVNAEKTAQQNKMSADAQMWSSQQAYLAAQNDSKYKNDNTVNPSTRQDYTDLEKQSIDSALVAAQKNYEAAEVKYKETDNAIKAAKAQITSSWYAYQQLSPVITAPRNGVVANLVIAPGSVITVQSTSTASNSTTPQQVGTITQPDSNTQASVDLAEIDAPKVTPGQKVTLTLDAFPNQTFAGKVLIVNTNGAVNSGVVTYPATIVFDTSQPNIYPNMAVTAQVITNEKKDVVLVPSVAIHTVGDRPAVRVMKDGKVSMVAVETGDANDTQTEIVSGINPGDTVVTGMVSTGTKENRPTGTSPFSSFGGGARGGGAVMFRKAD